MAKLTVDQARSMTISQLLDQGRTAIVSLSNELGLVCHISYTAARMAQTLHDKLSTLPDAPVSFSSTLTHLDPTGVLEAIERGNALA